MDPAYIVSGVVLLVGLAVLGWFATRRRRAVARTSETASLPPWDPEAAMRRLVLDTEELRRLYARLGYDLEVEAHVDRLLQALKAMIRADVPDFGALRAALAKDPAPRDTLPASTDRPDPDLHPAEVLLREVLAAGPDEQRVHALLNRDPMREPLPFAEVLPVERDGRATWQPVIEVTLVRKRPTDARRFLQVLEQLETLVHTSGLARSERAARAVLDAIARLRASLKRPHANVPLALNTLEEQLEQWMHRAHLQEAHTCKLTLDALLRSVVILHHTYTPPHRHGHPLGADALASYQQQARQHAAAYLEAPWMHGPRLTALLLVDLLDAERSAFSEKEQAQAALPAGVVRLVRGEIASGYYDRDELIRRLREQEARGLYVHSLVHALLRLEPAANR